MVTPERDLGRLLATLQPELDPVTYAFVRYAGEHPPPAPPILGSFREAEGWSLIVTAADAEAAGWPAAFLARRIVLRVYSDLEAVGMLAGVATSLAEAGIAVNPVSGVAHDHLFVPLAAAERALGLLQQLQAQGRSGRGEAVYSVTIRIDAPIQDEWLGWMQAVHIPAVLATGCFRSCLVQRESDPPSGGRAVFVLDYRARSLDAIRRYQHDFAPALQQEHTRRYAGRFEASRSVRTVEI